MDVFKRVQTPQISSTPRSATAFFFSRTYKWKWQLCLDIGN